MAERQKIIVVDDNDYNLLVSKNILKPYYTVFTVPSAARMFDLIGKVHPDLILLDVEMPEIDGYEAAKKLVKEHSGIPFIFISGNTDEESKKKGLALGAINYFSKPLDADEILTYLEKYFA